LATKLRISPVTTNAAATLNHVLPMTRRHQGLGCGGADRGGVVVSVTCSRYLSMQLPMTYRNDPWEILQRSPERDPRETGRF